MAGVGGLVRDLVPLVCLVLLVALMLGEAGAVVSTVVPLVAVAAVLASGALSWARVSSSLEQVDGVVLFLLTILVVSEVCARAGLFEAAARALATASGTGTTGGGARRRVGRRLLLGVFLLAAAVTVVLGLDATVVLLTPVVVAATARMGVPARPAAYVCLRMANSASLLLPVSNLTNLLVVGRLGLGFGDFLAAVAPVWLAVLVVEYAGLRWVFRHQLAVAAPPATGAEPDSPSGSPEGPAGTLAVPAAVVVTMLAGFVAASASGVPLFWVSGSAAVLLAGWARVRGVSSQRTLARAASVPFGLIVLALAVVVAALARGPLRPALAALVPAGTTYLDLLLLALIATVLANLVTNLSATLVLLPLVAPLGTTAVLATLIGLNVGAGLTYPGSLANLLWRRGLAGQGLRIGYAEFHRVSLMLTPAAVIVAVSTLAVLS